MSQPKPLLIPWLRKQINSGRYPGVCWTNQEQTEFCIPWKHALRQDSSSDDSLIFKAWAEASSGRGKGNSSIWKRNFRAALKAKGFTMITDNKNDAANPHKLFKWPDESSMGGSQDPEPFMNQGPSPELDSHVQPCFEDLHLSTESTSNSGQQQYSQEGLNRGNMFLGQQQDMDELKRSVGEAIFPEPQVHLMAEQQVMEQIRDTLSSTRADNHFITDFRVCVYYRGVKVSEQLVTNTTAFRLVYRPEQMQSPVLDQDSGKYLVFLPNPESLQDQKQAKLTQQILNGLGEGIEVGVSGAIIYGHRMGASKAYWSFDKFDMSRRPQEVSKHQMPLYLTKNFIEGLSTFIANHGEMCPPISLFFCLGEKWPDPNNKPMEKKLITFEVVFVALELLKSMAVDGGASSLQSVELQLSLQESLHEMMEWMDSL